MNTARRLVLACVLDVAFMSSVLAATGYTHPKTAPPEVAASTRHAAPQPRSGAVLRQDLFDRRNPNNARSDLPAPPAQPGQF